MKVRDALAVLCAVLIILAALLLLGRCAATVRQTTVPQTYTIYFPFVPQTQFAGHGVAGVPVAELGADWYYVYGWCAPPCVPMDSAEMVGFRGWCADTIMLGNEPELAQWTGRPVIPVENLVAQSFILRANCPDAYIVALNFSGTPQGLEYAKEFIARGGEYDTLGFHAYCESWQDCAAYIDYIKSVFPNTPLCLSEFNSVYEDLDNWRNLLDAVHIRLACSAVFLVCWECEGQDDLFDLQTPKGTLTPKGLVFSTR